MVGRLANAACDECQLLTTEITKELAEHALALLSSHERREGSQSQSESTPLRPWQEGTIQRLSALSSDKLNCESSKEEGPNLTIRALKDELEFEDSGQEAAFDGFWKVVDLRVKVQSQVDSQHTRTPPGAGA